MPSIHPGRMRLVVDGDVTGMNRAMRSMQANLSRSERGMVRLQGRASSLTRTSSLLTSNIGTLAIIAGSIAARSFVEFDQAMASVLGTSGATGRQFERLRDQAKELGRTTRFTAAQAAEGQLFLARAGFEANEIFQALPGTLRLAQATMIDVGRASDIVTNIMSAFGVRIEETGRFVDVLAKTTASSNTNILQLAEALKFIGPISNSLGVSLEETSAFIGVLGDNAIQASMAGTGLRRAFFRLLNPTDDVQEALKDVGLSMEDVNITAHGATEVLRRFADVNLTTAQAGAIFGQRGFAIVEILTQNIDRVIELTGVLNNAENFTLRLAEIMDNTLRGALLRLSSAFQGLVIEFLDSDSRATTLGQTLDDISRALNNMTDNIAKVGPIISFTVKLLIGFSLATSNVAKNLFSLGASVAGVFSVARAANVSGFALLGLSSNVRLVNERLLRFDAVTNLSARSIRRLARTTQLSGDGLAAYQRSVNAVRGALVSLGSTLAIGAALSGIILITGAFRDMNATTRRAREELETLSFILDERLVGPNIEFNPDSVKRLLDMIQRTEELIASLQELSGLETVLDRAAQSAFARRRQEGFLSPQEQLVLEAQRRIELARRAEEDFNTSLNEFHRGLDLNVFRDDFADATIVVGNLVETLEQAQLSLYRNEIDISEIVVLPPAVIEETQKFLEETQVTVGETVVSLGSLVKALELTGGNIRTEELAKAFDVLAEQTRQFEAAVDLEGVSEDVRELFEAGDIRGAEAAQKAADAFREFSQQIAINISRMEEGAYAARLLALVFDEELTGAQRSARAELILREQAVADAIEAEKEAAEQARARALEAERAAEAERKRQEAIQGTIQALRDEGLAYSLTAEQIKLKNFIEQGANEEQIRLFDQILRGNSVLRERAELERDSASSARARQDAIAQTIKQLDDEALAYSLTADQIRLKEFIEQGANEAQIERYNQSLARNRVLQEQVDAERAAAEALLGRQREVAQFAQELADSTASFFGDAITGAESLGDAIRGLVGELVRLTIRFAILQPLANFFTGGISRLFGLPPLSIPGRQSGGLAYGPTLVGEAGPEIVNFAQPSRVVPNDRLGGLGANVNVTFAPTINGGSQSEVEDVLLAYEPHFRRVAVAAVADAFSGSGELRRIGGR